ncbi:hypothetical protein ACS5PK_04505 [Roseateles sp. DB2]|uniref:hypothetical protein n=1 Tax=Roseateles sp. DB2 TaxID=3453717 RepID=UPI003EE97E64
MQTFPDLQVFLAGGVIRQLMTGHGTAPKDFDCFLAGPSVEQAVASLAREGTLHRTPYGAPRWYPQGEPSCYADLIPIADFVPGLWPCEDIVDVLNQFDFTANAVAIDLRSWVTYDPQHGLRDARRRVMRMVRFDYPSGPYIAGASLDRNVVLWFRVIHYASTLALEIEPLTAGWLRQHRRWCSHEAEFARLFFKPDLRALAALGVA